MNKTKIIIGLMVAMVVAVVAIGAVSAQTTTPTPTTTPSQGFLGWCYSWMTGHTGVQGSTGPAQNMWAWMQNCYKFVTGQSGPTTATPSNPTAYGPCWTWR